MSSLQQVESLAERALAQAGFPSRLIPMAGGGRLDLEAPEPTYLAVATGLAQTQRWCRQAPFPYSVAQHSVLLAWYLEECGATEREQRAALWHDAAEFIYGDEPRFMKCCTERDEAKLRLADAVLDLAGLETADLGAVKLIDRQMQWDECRALFPLVFAAEHKGEPLLGVQIERWSFERARDNWLELALQLQERKEAA